MIHGKKGCAAVLLVVAVMVCSLVMLGGCATCGDVRTEAQKAMQRADEAFQEAQSAKAAALDCSKQAATATAAAERAEDAAARSERAAQQAMDYSRKAEAVFNKMMTK
jgi:predicted  nucleic acid-binding Zn-ribbon protein